MATVGDPGTEIRMFFCLCLLRVLLILTAQSRDHHDGTRRAPNLPYYDGEGAADRRPHVLCSPSFSDDRSSIRSQLSLSLPSLSVISDLFVNWSYKLFHILISRPRFVSLLLLLSLFPFLKMLGL